MDIKESKNCIDNFSTQLELSEHKNHYNDLDIVIPKLSPHHPKLPTSYNFFTWKNNHICLICKTAIVNDKNNDQSITNHLITNEHKEKLSTMFKLFFYCSDCVDNKQAYGYLANNSVIDVPGVDLKTGFIYSEGIRLYCSVCDDEEVPFSQTEDTDILNCIKDHLDSNAHIRKFSICTSWVCYLPSLNGYIIFNKYLVFCSVCDVQIACGEQDVDIAVQHLESNHSVELEKYFINKEHDYRLIRREICSVPLSVPKNIKEVSDSASSVSSNETWFDAEFESDEYEMSIDPTTCSSDTFFSPEKDIIYANTSVLNDLNTFNHIDKNVSKISASEKEFEVITYDKDLNSTSIPNTEGSLTNFMESSVVGVINFCSECGDSFEVLNGDMEFSLQIHSQKHTQLTSLSDRLSALNTSYCSVDENVDYVCADCNQVILIFNKNVDLSFERHHEEFHSSSQSLVSVKERLSINDIFFSNVFEILPPMLRFNKPFIALELNTMYCRLCNCTIDIHKDSIELSTRLLRKHLVLQYHRNQYELVLKDIKDQKYFKISKKNSFEVNQKLESISEKPTKQSTASLIIQETPVEGSNLQSSSGKLCTANSVDVIKLKEEENVLKTLPNNLIIHREFLVLENSKIKCKLCSTLMNLNVTSMKKHLTDLSHKLNLFTEIKRSLCDDLKIQVQFLVLVDGQLFCDLCSCFVTSYNDSKTVIESIEDHFLGIIHHNNNSCEQELNNLSLSANSKTKVEAIHENNGVNVTDTLSSQLQTVNLEVPGRELSLDSNLTTTKEEFTTVVHDTFNLRNEFPQPKYNLNLSNIISNGQDYQYDLLNSGFEEKYIADKQSKKIKEQDSKTKYISEYDRVVEDLLTVGNNVSKISSYDQFEEEVASTSSGISKRIHNLLHVSDPELMEIKNLVPKLEENMKFLLRHESHYYCTLCSRGINYSRYPSVLAENIEFHLNKSEHKYLEELELNSDLSNLHHPTKQMSRLISVASTNHIISNNVKFIEDNGVNFYCTLCDIIISNSHSDSGLAKNLFCHFTGKSHTNALGIRKASKLELTVDPILNEIVKVVPKLKEWLKFISRPDNNYYCSLCSSGITYSPCYSKLAKNFQAHLNQKHKIHIHRKQSLNPSNQATPSLPRQESRNLSLSEKRLQNVSSISYVIEENMDLIGFIGVNFSCELCNVTILNSPVNSTLADNFISHFIGKCHKYNLKLWLNKPFNK